MSSLRRLFATSTFVLFTLLPADRALASTIQGFQTVSAEELGMKGEPLAPGAPAIILFREVNCDNMAGSTHEYNYYRIKILSDEGRKYADIEIPFFDGVSDVTGINARTIRPDGSIVNFQGKLFEKTVVQSQGTYVSR
jgi:hypothetical protein